MKINYILLLFCCVIGFGCKKTVDYSNPYYDRMKKLADEAEADPNDKTALHKLEEYVTDSDSWNRIYSYGFLGELALKNIGGCQAALIPYFDDALKDSDYNVRQMGVQAVRDIGSPAVEKCLPELVLMVQRGNEDDITWHAVDALGELVDKKKAHEILLVLLKAANKPPDKGTSDEAPQVRYEALNSIEELAKNNLLNVDPELENLLSVSQFPYKERVAKAILELDPTDKAAQQVISKR